MSIATWFWLIYVLTAIFGFWSNWPDQPGPMRFRPFGYNLVLMVLLFLLGYGIFGGPLK